MTYSVEDQGKKDLAQVIANLEHAEAILEMAIVPHDEASAESNARTLVAVRAALEAVHVIANLAGGVPKPVRH